MLVKRTSRRRGFTLVELLVVIAIIGVLVALLLPAVQYAREAGRKATCKNHLRQIGVATNVFHDTYKTFPPANLKPRPSDPPESNCGGKEPTWLVRLLPYLEQLPAYERWDLFRPYDGQPAEIRLLAVETYLCPSRRGPSRAVTQDQTLIFTLPCGCSLNPQFFPGGASSDYGGNMGDPSPGLGGFDTDFYWGGNGTGVIVAARPQCQNGLPVNCTDRVGMTSVEDGLSLTLLAGELHVPLGKLNISPFNGPAYNGNHFPAFARIGGPGFPLADMHDGLESDSFRFGSWHAGGCQFVLADGSTRFVASSIPSSVLGRLCHRSDHAAVTELP